VGKKKDEKENETSGSLRDLVEEIGEQGDESEEEFEEEEDDFEDDESDEEDSDDSEDDDDSEEDDSDDSEEDEEENESSIDGILDDLFADSEEDSSDFGDTEDRKLESEIAKLEAQIEQARTGTSGPEIDPESLLTEEEKDELVGDPDKLAKLVAKRVLEANSKKGKESQEKLGELQQKLIEKKTALDLSKAVKVLKKKDKKFNQKLLDDFFDKDMTTRQKEAIQKHSFDPASGKVDFVKAYQLTQAIFNRVKGVKPKKSKKGGKGKSGLPNMNNMNRSGKGKKKTKKEKSGFGTFFSGQRFKDAGVGDFVRNLD